MDARSWAAALVRLLLQVALVAVAAVLAVCVLAMALCLAVAWSMRLAWARLTGRPAGAWHMGLDPAGRFWQAYRTYGAAGRRPGAGRAASAEAEPSPARAAAGPLPLRSRGQGVTDVESRPVGTEPPG
ncbi:MAG: hypothetical protein PGN26_15250 [Xylophilus ampelinus]